MADVVFGPLGFAREALASYAIFRQMKAAGEIAQAQRFMVALPTPWAPVYSFISYRWQREVHARYEAAVLGELAEIVAGVPADELALQWDVATEMSWWERVYPAPFEAIEAEIVESLLRLLRAVPARVELGLHLCYGSMNNRHWKEPADTGHLVTLTNALTRSLERPIDFLHLPVPQNRTDAGYFAPLASLDLSRVRELYLGLLHLDDGVPGALERVAAARAFVPRFGIACECGLGRRKPDAIPDWLSLHAAVASRLDAPDVTSHQPTPAKDHS
jgi:hypothetical protein